MNLAVAVSEVDNEARRIWNTTRGTPCCAAFHTLNNTDLRQLWSRLVLDFQWQPADPLVLRSWTWCSGFVEEWFVIFQTNNHFWDRLLLSETCAHYLGRGWIGRKRSAYAQEAMILLQWRSMMSPSWSIWIYSERALTRLFTDCHQARVKENRFK